jgi:hypothetical protein
MSLNQLTIANILIVANFDGKFENKNDFTLIYKASRK